MNYPPYGYQPFQAVPPVQPMQQQPQQGQQAMIWVNGMNEAMGYPVCPNSAVTLWDSSAPCLYVKSADQTGRPTLKTYDLVERVGQGKPDNEEYVTRKEFEELVRRLKKENAE